MTQWWNRYWPLGAGFIVALGLFSIGWGIASVSGSDSNWHKKIKLCDKSVDALLHSRDLIEVVRSGFIVIHLDCWIGGHRLDKEES